MRERTNKQWLAELQGPNPDEALADIYDLLVRGLRVGLGNYGGGVEANAEDFAQEALIKITSNLDSFRGESRFTTWAQKIAMNVALTELKRRRWRDVYLQELFARREGADRGPADPHLTSEQLALQNTVLGELRRMINEELTDRQREAVGAGVIGGVALSGGARGLGTTPKPPLKAVDQA